MSLLLIKACVTIAIVLGLSIIAERASPRLAGLLGGFPLSVAIVLIFIGIEEGQVFGAESAVHTIAGLSANLSIFAAYGLCLSLKPDIPVIFSIFIGLAAFFAVAFGLAEIPFSLEGATFFSLCAIALCLFSFKRFRDMKIEKAVKLGVRITFIRAASACFVVLAITGLAETLGAQKAGVLAGFPATVLPMIVIIHATYGAAPVLSIIKHFPAGLIATVIFCVTYAIYLVDLGQLFGTLLSFGTASFYLLAFSTLQQKMRRNR